MFGGKSNLWASLKNRRWAWLAAAAGALMLGALGALPRSADNAAYYERWGVDPNNLPYRHDIAPADALSAGQARAAGSGKLLMVTFGANWCPDCLTLQKNLREPATRDYASRHFEIVDIDVGDAAHAATVQRDLGIPVNSIPLAIFYSPQGELIGDTFGGELHASRHYTSRDIRDFLREIVEYGRVVSPDQRQ
jgi:thioredoxin